MMATRFAGYTGIKRKDEVGGHVKKFRKRNFLKDISLLVERVLHATFALTLILHIGSHWFKVVAAQCTQ